MAELQLYPNNLAVAARAVLKKEIRHLQLIPTVAVKLLKLANDENTKVRDLSTVIETEPALAAKVLRIVNSAAFCLPNKITSIKHAVNLLGFSSVRQIALDQLLYNRLIKHNQKQRFDQLFFWQHCLFVATLSREIALSLNHPEPDMIYTGGLLHDIGKLVLETYGRVTYSDFLNSMDSSDCALIENESVFFGLNHAEVGRIFSVTWNLPPAIIAMISCRSEFPDESSPFFPYLTEIAIVSFSDYIAWIQGLGSIVGLTGPRLPEQVLKIIDINQIDLEQMLEKVDQEMNKTRDFYDIKFPSITKLRATLVHTTINMGQNDKLLEAPVSENKTNINRSSVYSLTIPHRSLDPDEFIPWTLESIHNDFNLDRVVMLDFDPKRRGLSINNWWPEGLDNSALKKLEIPITSMSGKILDCMRSRKPVLINQNEQENKSILNLFAVNEFILVPVLRHNRLVGLVYGDNLHSNAELDSHLLNDMMPIVNELGIALLNARQYSMARKQAQIDPLTQLYNKRVIDEFLTHLFNHEAELLSSTVIGFIDIDKFKLFNDLCGHQAGDDVLKIVADILRNMTRPGDMIGRYGGEEFLFILRNTDKKGALICAERIRSEIERKGKILQDRFNKHALTASIGVALYSPQYIKYKDFIASADKAMYKAKQEGRNRVVILT